MYRWMLDYLICLDCDSELPLQLFFSESHEKNEILSGTLECGHCRRTYPIINGVPRFIASENYSKNFGNQWNRWKSIQIDRLSGHQLSETRFFKDTGWSPEWLQGQLILDAGCGAGRFTDIALKYGAKVIAFDMSHAVDACYDNNKIYGENLGLLQASIYQLPLKKNIVGGLYCMGVIQHTPDPQETMRCLLQYLQPGGRLVYNFYEKDFWPKLQWIKYALRCFTPHFSEKTLLILTKILVTLFFPITHTLAKIPKLRLLNHFLPIAASHHPELTKMQQYEWTLLDTFDWYSPKYEIRQSYRDVMQLLSDFGLRELEGRAGIIKAKI